MCLILSKLKNIQDVAILFSLSHKIRERETHTHTQTKHKIDL